MKQERHIFIFGELLDAIYKSGIVLRIQLALSPSHTWLSSA
jgi:hypothetical protein